MDTTGLDAKLTARIQEVAAALDNAGFKSDLLTTTALIGLFLRVTIPIYGVEGVASRLRQMADDMAPQAKAEDNRVAEMFAKFSPKVVH